MRRYALLAAGLTLAGCGDKNIAPPPAVQVKIVERVVEVPKPCPVTRPAVPAKLARPLPTDAVALAALALAKLAEWAGAGGYGERADAAIVTCTKP